MKKEFIGIIGLGYVGFPLACLFARKYKVIGFDRNERRVGEIQHGMHYRQGTAERMQRVHHRRSDTDRPASQSRTVAAGKSVNDRR